MDFKHVKSDLEKSDNPFASVILAQLAALETSKNSKKRLASKIELTRMLFKKGWLAKDIRSLYKFIDGIMVLPEEFKLKYHEEAKKIEKENKVSYLTTAEEIGLAQGFKRGLQKGRKEGKIEGEKLGLNQGKETLLIDLLKCKFGQIPEHYQERLHLANNDTLSQWAKRLLNAKNIEEIFETL